MAASNIIYVLTIVLYSLSVFGYFIDFLQNNRKANRLAFWFLSIVWVLQTIFLVLRAFQFERLPLLTPFEGLFFYAWAMVTLSLLVNFYFRVDFLVFFMNVVGFSLMAVSLFFPTDNLSPVWEDILTSELLILHVTLIILSYAGFTVAFACSVLYLMEHQMLKNKNWGKRLLRFGSLNKLDRFSYVGTMCAYPLLLLGVILGFIWAYSGDGMHSIPLFDPKVLGSLAVLVFYGGYLYQKAVKGKQGYGMAFYNMLGFLILLANYLLTSEWSSFHIWSV
ncbi:cytochrome c biogenesis protein CcsA [Salicibibacter cibarius]|uniref:Cytochrome c biogenesis protein CcsA n=1 Tax=Salicibibacter cibarius TaxID=2743000 RepID=A0A7T6Z517_9BACI|nr:cytochrome c biogenesis protein CcsA [Salicibibacter cibarius]QQK77130.1 cytochrome c biogenesis protein CcsA [Salicibibacter cibarius]